MAGRSHGVVTRARLLAAGITPAEIRQRLRTGALLREHPGVYRVGHRAPSIEARYLAAVWACGDGAVLSGRAAGHLWGLLKGAAPAPEVTTPYERRVQGVTTHRARSIEATTHRGIPITTVARTFLDLAATRRPPRARARAGRAPPALRPPRHHRRHRARKRAPGQRRPRPSDRRRAETHPQRARGEVPGPREGSGPHGA